MTLGTSHTSRILILSLVISLSGCVIHVGNGSGNSEGGEVSSVFGDVGVSAGKQVGDVSSVNGDVELEQDVSARTVNTVNGSIEMASGVSVREANTVNGDIQAGQHFFSDGNVETVNGQVSVAHSSQIEGDVETVNGDIKLDGVKVSGNVISKNGSMFLTQDTAISGDIVFKGKERSSKFSYRKSLPTLSIARNAKVEGNIILNRPVILELENEKLNEKVIERFSRE